MTTCNWNWSFKMYIEMNEGRNYVNIVTYVGMAVVVVYCCTMEKYQYSAEK